MGRAAPPSQPLDPTAAVARTIQVLPKRVGRAVFGSAVGYRAMSDPPAGPIRISRTMRVRSG